MKRRYDKDSKVRSFSPGDKVLLFLPVPCEPLSARYYGPYEIESQSSELNYIVKTPDRRKQRRLCHVNMIKQYHTRDTNGNDVINVQHVNSVGVAVSVTYPSKGGDIEVGTAMKLKNSQILCNLEDKLSHLEAHQIIELAHLVRKYHLIFPDIPSKTSIDHHDVEIGDALPIKQHPYRLNPLKLEAMRNEIKYMLDNGIIEHSKSDFSSPSMIIPKPDGSYRFITDFRAVNAITKSDSYPIPRIEYCIDKIGESKFVSKYDLLKGFYQMPLTDRAKLVSAFVTPDGLYNYCVMPFGMKNCPATFQRLINRVISGLNE